MDGDDRLFLFATLLLKYRDEAKGPDEKDRNTYNDLSAHAREGTDPLKDCLNEKLDKKDRVIETLINVSGMRAADGTYNEELLDKFTDFLSSISAIFSPEATPLSNQEPEPGGVLNKLREHLTKEEKLVEDHMSSKERYDFRRPGSSLVLCSLRDKSSGVYVVFKFDANRATSGVLDDFRQKSKEIAQGCYLHCKEGQGWATLIGITRDFNDDSVIAAEQYIDKFVSWAESNNPSV